MFGIGSRIGRPGRAALLVMAGAAGGGAALAVASVPDGNGVVHACYPLATGSTLPSSTANLRIIDPSAGQTCSTSVPPGGGLPPERALNWNMVGAQGPRGAPGLVGPPGRIQTIVAGQTLTIPGGHVITVGGSSGVTILPAPIPSGGRSVARLVINPGRRGALGFDLLAVGFAIHGSGTGGGGTGNGGGAGKVAVHDISITKLLDKSSPKLVQDCLNGTHLKQVTITRSNKGKVYLRYDLKDVLVSSYRLSPSGGGGKSPQDSLTLDFASIQISTH